MAKKLWIVTLLILWISHGTFGQLSYSWDQSVSVLIDSNEVSLPWAGGLNSAQVSTLDLDQDLDNDIIIFDRSCDKIFTFLYSDSTYTYAPEYESYFPGSLTGWVLLRDFDCDGQKDLFTHTPFGIKVYKNVTVPGSMPSWQLIQDPIFTEGSSGQINLQVSILDLPGIDDIDGDGDLDILVYNFAVGGGIEFHKNMSMENTGNCGLELERMTKTWGNFLECKCDTFAFGGQTCEEAASHLTSSRSKHIGGKTIMTLDSDGDGDKEVLIGQEDCSRIYFLENEGTSENAFMSNFSMQYPDTINPIDYHSFPAGYLEDVDNDGLNDLLSSPNFSFNYENGVDFRHSLWFYRNNGTLSIPQFEFVTTHFLQDQMIDVGENASPAVFDYDKDGDEDLFIANKGLPEAGKLISSISLFENTGNARDPNFVLLDQDYLGIRSLGLSDLSVQFMDINNDGNEDLLFMGSQDGVNSKIFILFNSSSSISAYNLDKRMSLALNLDVEDRFHFTPVNSDDLIDLFVTRSSGQLDYFRNVGSSSNPEFVLDTQGYYNISADFNRKNLRAVTADLNHDGMMDLLTSDDSGVLKWYSGFRSNTGIIGEGEALSYAGSISNDPIDYNFGKRSSITATRIFPDEEPAVIVGLKSGGLQILRKADAKPDGNTSDPALSIILYPNPVSRQKGSLLSVSSNSDARLQILTYIGQAVSGFYSIEPGKKLQLDIGNLNSGLYLMKLQSKSGKIEVKRFLIIN